MYPYRVALARPYWTGATYRAMARSFFSGSVGVGSELDQLRALILKELGVEDAILCGSGSFALEIALQLCGVKDGDEVVIPTFCCTAVVAPTLAIGAIPVLADVGKELNITVETVEAALTEKIKAIVVPHLFGNPADIDGIIDLARERNICVIDDAAQALGATLNGRAAGSFGDAGILSFGSEKVCSGIGGGALLFSKRVPFDAEDRRDLAAPRVSQAMVELFSTLVWRRWRRWTRPAKGGFAAPSPDSPPLPYRRETSANLKASIALTLMQNLPENLRARRARVHCYREWFAGEEGLQPIEHRSGSACLTQVVRVVPRGRSQDPAARVIEALRRAGFEVQGSYVPIHLLSPFEKFVRTPLPHAERVWADLVELPCEPDVGLDDVEKIAHIVKQAVR